jgi:hypothetical protein
MHLHSPVVPFHLHLHVHLHFPCFGRTIAGQRPAPLKDRRYPDKQQPLSNACTPADMPNNQ